MGRLAEFWRIWRVDGSTLIPSLRKKFTPIHGKHLNPCTKYPIPSSNFLFLPISPSLKPDTIAPRIPPRKNRPFDVGNARCESLRKRDSRESWNSEYFSENTMEGDRWWPRGGLSFWENELIVNFASEKEYLGVKLMRKQSANRESGKFLENRKRGEIAMLPHNPHFTPPTLLHAEMYILNMQEIEFPVCFRCTLKILLLTEIISQNYWVWCFFSMMFCFYNNVLI